MRALAALPPSRAGPVDHPVRPSSGGLSQRVGLAPATGTGQQRPILPPRAQAWVMCLPLWCLGQRLPLLLVSIHSSKGKTDSRHGRVWCRVRAAKQKMLPSSWSQGINVSRSRTCSQLLKLRMRAMAKVDRTSIQ